MSKAKSREDLESLRKKCEAEFSILTSEKIHENSFFYVQLEKVAVSKKVIDMYIVSKKIPKVVFVVGEREGKILLICQYRHFTKDISYEVVAGSVDENESLETAAKREFLEETGYKPKEIKLIGENYIAPGIMSQKGFVYLATNLEQYKNEQLDGEIILDRDFYDMTEVREMINDGRLNDGPSIVALTYYSLYRNNHD